MSQPTTLLELYLAHEDDLKVFIRSLVRDRQDFDDVCQTVVVRLLESFENYDHQRPFGPWARGIAVNVVLKLRRDSGRSPTPFSTEMITRIHDSYEQRQTQQRGERAEALEHCLQALPDDSQQMLALRYGQLLSLADVAQRVDRTAAATQRALSRIRKQLTDCIQRRLKVTHGGSA